MKTPPRFTADVTSAGAEIGGAQLHHLRNVIRLHRGDQIVVLDRRGAEHAGRIREITPDRALIDCAGLPSARPRVSLILVAAIIKASRMDFLIEKAVELGASEIWPIKCAHGQIHSVGAQRLARWRRVAAAAARQSLAPIHPEILPEQDFDRILNSREPRTTGIICVQGAAPMRDALAKPGIQRLAILCGPEGGFTSHEIESAANAGFIRVSLGPNRLRAETAALAALSIATAILDDAQGASSAV